MQISQRPHIQVWFPTPPFNS